MLQIDYFATEPDQKQTKTIQWNTVSEMIYTSANELNWFKANVSSSQWMAFFMFSTEPTEKPVDFVEFWNTASSTLFSTTNWLDFDNWLHRIIYAKI